MVAPRWWSGSSISSTNPLRTEASTSPLATPWPATSATNTARQSSRGKKS